MLFVIINIYFDKKGDESTCNALKIFDESNITGKLLTIKTSNSAYTITVENDPKEYLVLIKSSESNGKFFRGAVLAQTSIVEKKKFSDSIKIMTYGKIYKYRVWRTLDSCEQGN